MKKFKVTICRSLIEAYRYETYHVEAESEDDIDIDNLDEDDLIESQLDIMSSESIDETIEEL